MVNSNTIRAWLGCVLVAAVGCSAELATDEVGLVGESLSAGHAPTVPDVLAVPADQRLALVADAEGVQIYVCQADATGTASWVFKAPRADLFNAHGKPSGKHYAGPTWEALDGSKVVAAKLAAYTADASAIPWLLLQATTHEGCGRMEHISYVQRLDTTAGLAPTGGCDAAHLGQESEVPYTATYYFYAPAHPGRTH